MEGRESDSSLGESLAIRSKRLRQPVSYDEAAKDAELDQQLRASEAGRGKRQRRAVSYDHAYLTQNWDDTDFEEDEAAYQERQAKKGRPTAGLSLYEALAREGREPPSQQLDLETAWAVGFMPGLTEEEEGLLPQGSDERLYIEIRNRLLTLWREDVSRWLSKEQAQSAVPPDMRAYAWAAWTFLNNAGYINFGVAPEIAAKALGMSQKRESVIIIGAGMAGLAAARKLRSFGFKVVILEGRGRPGGRVYTKQLQGQGHAAVGDLGGSIITGIDGNPLAVLAAQLNIPMHEINTAGVPLYLEDGKVPHPDVDAKAFNSSQQGSLHHVQREQLEIEKLSNELLDSCDQFRESMVEVTDNVSLATALETLWSERVESSSSSNEGNTAGAKEGSAAGRSRLERRVLDWHFANLEFANAAPLRKLSLRTWDQDDPHEMQGAHCFLPGGNIRLVAGLAEGLPILYNSVVQDIHYSESRVRVSTASKSFEADAVLVTAPLGVLKAGTLKFRPPLPERKMGAIQRMGFGVLNKVVMLFPHAFWSGQDMFGRIAPSVGQRGEFFLFYSYANISGGALLAALVAGDSAQDFEHEDPKESARKVLRVLRGMYEPKKVNVPAPLQVCCTRWGGDPMARGSYSSIGVGALGGEEYDTLAESLGGRVFFAGEHTTKKHPATMHGAFLSGHCQAANINATFAKRKADAEASAAAEATASLRRSRGQSAAAQAALARQQREEAKRLASQAFHLAQALHKVFNDVVEPPDAEFGCFAALYGPRRTRFEKEAILRADIGAGRTGRGKPLPALIPVSRSEVTRLRNLPGGDDVRFGQLMGSLGIRLVGRARPLEHLALMKAILHARGIKLPSDEGPDGSKAKAAAALSVGQPQAQQQGAQVKQEDTSEPPVQPHLPSSVPQHFPGAGAGQQPPAERWHTPPQQPRPAAPEQQPRWRVQTNHLTAAAPRQHSGPASPYQHAAPHQQQQQQQWAQPGMQHGYSFPVSTARADAVPASATGWGTGGAPTHAMPGGSGGAYSGQGPPGQYPGLPAYSPQAAGVPSAYSQQASTANSWQNVQLPGPPGYQQNPPGYAHWPPTPQTHTSAPLQQQPNGAPAAFGQQAGGVQSSRMVLTAEMLNALSALAPALQQLQQPKP